LSREKNSTAAAFGKACENRGDQRARRPDVSHQPLNMDAVLVITNPFTQEEQECRIVFSETQRIKAAHWTRVSSRLPPHFLGVDFVPRGLAPAACRRSPELIPLCVSAVSHAHSASSFSIVVSLISDLVLTIVDTGYKKSQFSVRDGSLFHRT